MQHQTINYCRYSRARRACSTSLQHHLANDWTFLWSCAMLDSCQKITALKMDERKPSRNVASHRTKVVIITSPPARIVYLRWMCTAASSRRDPRHHTPPRLQHFFWRLALRPIHQSIPGSGDISFHRSISGRSWAGAIVFWAQCVAGGSEFDVFTMCFSRLALRNAETGKEDTNCS